MGAMAKANSEVGSVLRWRTSSPWKTATTVYCWLVGVTANGRGSRGGTQLALPIEPPEPPELEPLGEWGELIADYRTTGMVLGRHPMELMRSELDPEILRSSDLERTEDGASVAVAGMDTARQRPETAKGIVFMLIEDERGSVNLIVPPRVYERHRRVVRASPLIRASGKLERRGTTNVLVGEIAELERVGREPGTEEPAPLARPVRPVHPIGAPSRRERELVVAELREVAPAGHSFGRRR